MTHRTPLAARSLALLGALAVTLGCSDPVSPPSFAGTYVLRSLEGNPVPAVAIDNGELYVKVLADTLELTGATSGLWTTHYEWRVDTAQLAPFVTSVPVTIERVGSELYLTEQWPCPTGAVCSPLIPRKLEIVGLELRMTTRAGAHRFERLAGSGGPGYGGY